MHRILLLLFLSTMMAPGVTHASTPGKATNRLAKESSPYLLQHASNPVDWYPWGEDAFAEARRRDVPIFLSIGYSACHWCHVMENESFSDPKIAAYMNEHFVSIKVDREERPDVDAIYVEAVRAFTGRAGWPLSVFLTPELEPFTGGTYFAPVERWGQPSFRQFLESVTEQWKGDRATIIRRAERARLGLNLQAQRVSGSHLPTQDSIPNALDSLVTREDKTYGGWGSKKFPRVSILEFLLDLASTGDPAAADLLTRTLKAMALGGIHDQLGGGFHRYTVDKAWKVPHYEKMLYDNAQLVNVYAEASRILGEPYFLDVAQDTTEWMISDLWSESEKAFASSFDADTAGEEGLTYVWNRKQIKAALSIKDAATAISQLHIPANGDSATPYLSAPPSVELKRIMSDLFVERTYREQPAMDTKVVVAWNGLALTAMAKAAHELNDSGLRKIAQSLAETLVHAITIDTSGFAQMPRTLSNGSPAGILDDYAFVAEGLLDLHEVDGNPRWLTEAHRLALAIQFRFGSDFSGDAAEKGGQIQGWYLTEHLSKNLIARQMEWDDGALPSGLGRTALVFQRLEAYGAEGVSPLAVSGALTRSSQYLEQVLVTAFHPCCARSTTPTSHPLKLS